MLRFLLRTVQLSVVMLHVAGSACAQGQAPSLAPDHEALVGCWYGEDYQPVTRQVTKWLMERRSDGTFTVMFRAPPPSNPHTEKGVWGRRGQTYFTRTTSINGMLTDLDDPFFYDDYRLEEVRGDRIVYFHIRQKVRFHSTRVDRDFRVP